MGKEINTLCADCVERGTCRQVCSLVEQELAAKKTSVKSFPARVENSAAIEIEANGVIIPDEFIFILSEKQREVYRLIMLDMTHEEIARRLKISRVSVTGAVRRIREKVLRVVEKMTESEREVFILFCRGICRTEISERLGLSHNMARVHLKRAKKKFLGAVV